MPGLELELRADRQVVSTTGGRVHVLARLRAPDVPRRQPRLPLNLALVIDASGSMSGPPLQAAKQAAAAVTERLTEEDIISVVSFSDDVLVHADATSAERRTSAMDAIHALSTRGSTDLAGGWLRGARCVADEMARRGGRRNHVVVFSDGRANRGLVDPAEIAQHARALRERQLCSSCVGIGEGYSTHQLYAIAEHGGGRLHHAADPNEIATVVLGELDDVRATAAESVTVCIGVPAGVSAQVLDACPVQHSGDALEADLGSLLAGANRDLVVRLDVPPAAAGEQVRIRVLARWSAPGAVRPEESAPVETTITSASESETESQEWDIQATQAAAAAWRGQLIQQAIELNRERRYDAVERLLADHIGPFEDYCANVRNGEDLVGELRRMLATTSRPWTERNRKEAEVHYYKQRKGETDKRGTRDPQGSLPL